MTQKEMDQNLMVVVAVEGYALRHHLNETDVYRLFQENNIPQLIRSQYDALHTQSLDESINFAEDVLARSL